MRYMRLSVLSIGIGIAQACFAEPWDVRDDWTFTTNPDGVWQYGYSNTLASAIILYDQKVATSGLEIWKSSTVDNLGTPAALVNLSGASVNLVPHNAFAMHPGLNTFALARWTSPSSYSLSISGTFGSGDIGNVDVYVRKNSVILFQQIGASADVPYDVDTSVVAGDKIEFVIGNAGSYLFDSTPLSALIESAGPTATGRISFQDYEGEAPTHADITFEDLNHNVVSVETVPLDSQGNFTAQMPTNSGMHFVYAKSGHWLRRIGGSVDTGTSVTGLEFSLINGDVDRDNEVTLVDFGMFASAFGSDPNSGNWIADADLNGDLEVNLVDGGILSARFGLAGD